ncbi:MAG: 3-methylornithyl-N6-L-lysine dehydrogenase PylD [Deltaproteobacteria bacterium]|nr:3-methylornithyl-N6-L-lysine dehydrogenase PylD [Deltaproteobacteria bacterium]
MTRLTATKCQEAKDYLQRIDQDLYERAHSDLRQVALRTIGIQEGSCGLPLQRLRLAVVPMTAGQGIISGFAEAVCAIAGHVGFHSWKTSSSDVAGIAEAYANGADILLLADDQCFLAINSRSRAIADNSRATGESFAVLLDMMVRGVSGRACGVIGCGPVGTASALRLAQMGAELTLCDINDKRARRLASEIRTIAGANVQWVREVKALINGSQCIVDATPAARIIDADAIDRDTVIVAPGVPHGLTPEAAAKIGRRFYHDSLPLGVATMALAAAFGQLTAAGDLWRQGDGEECLQGLAAAVVLTAGNNWDDSQ